MSQQREAFRAHCVQNYPHANEARLKNLENDTMAHPTNICRTRVRGQTIHKQHVARVFTHCGNFEAVFLESFFRFYHLDIL